MGRDFSSKDHEFILNPIKLMIIKIRKFRDNKIFSNLDLQKLLFLAQFTRFSYQTCNIVLFFMIFINHVYDI